MLFKWLDSHHHNERMAGRHVGVRTAISIHKTDVAATADVHSSYRAEREQNNRIKNCPLHNKSHPLDRCRGFRAKPLAERKKLLKEHKRCLKQRSSSLLERLPCWRGTQGRRRVLLPELWRCIWGCLGCFRGPLWKSFCCTESFPRQAHEVA